MKVGDTVTMLFNLMGMTSEEECEVIKVNKNIVTLNNEFKFNLDTKKCINDNTFGGASRRLK